MGTFLITGAAKRLGAAMAEHLAGKGHDLILHYRDSVDLAKALQKKILGSFPGRKVHLVQRDLLKGAAGLMEECQNLAPDLQGLINNASLFTKGNLEESAHFQEMLQIHAVAPQVLSADFHRLLGRGLIVNIADAFIADYNSHFQNYRISKFLLTELTRQSARHFAPKIRVNAIAPGPILPAEGDTKEEFGHVVKRTPLGFSPGTPGILSCLDFILASEFLTGQILYADSGQHL